MDLDGIFAALGDPTRRRIVERLSRGEQAVGDLAAPSGMTLTGFLKHVAVLERAGLVARRKVGRTVYCRLEPLAMNNASNWIERHRRMWETQFDSLAAHLGEED